MWPLELIVVVTSPSSRRCLLPVEKLPSQACVRGGMSVKVWGGLPCSHNHSLSHVAPPPSPPSCTVKRGKFMVSEGRPSNSRLPRM